MVSLIVLCTLIIVKKDGVLKNKYWITVRTEQIVLQGDVNQNQLFQMAVPLKLCISDPTYVNKVKMRLRGGSFFFNCRKFIYIFQPFVYNFSKKFTASRTHFGFTNIGSEMHSFRGTAI